jgi:hypothetical protein
MDIDGDDEPNSVSSILHQISTRNAYKDWCKNHHSNLDLEKCVKTYQN